MPTLSNRQLAFIWIATIGLVIFGIQAYGLAAYLEDLAWYLVGYLGTLALLLAYCGLRRWLAS